MSGSDNTMPYNRMMLLWLSKHMELASLMNWDWTSCLPYSLLTATATCIEGRRGGVWRERSVVRGEWRGEGREEGGEGRGKGRGNRVEKGGVKRDSEVCILKNGIFLLTFTVLSQLFLFAELNGYNLQGTWQGWQKAGMSGRVSPYYPSQAIWHMECVYLAD